MPTLNHPQHTAPQAYRVLDFCQAVGIGVTTVYRMIGDGSLQSVKIRNRRLIPATEVTRLLSEAR